MTLSIERRAARWGDRAAVIDVSEEELYAPAGTVAAARVTYDGLRRLIEHTSGVLAERGIEAGDTVCAITRNRVAVLGLLFACRRLGATFAPVSHRLTPATVGRPLEALDPDLVVFEPAQRDLTRELPPARTATFSTLVAAEAGSMAASPASTAADPLLALHDDAGDRFAAYSSAAVEWNCLSVALTLGIGRTDRLPLLGPLSSYDGLLRVALPTLYVGGTLVLDRAFDPDDALAAIRREQATVLVGRAVAFRELADCDGFSGALESVDRIVSEPAPAEEIREVYAAAGTPIDRAYGRLECPTALVQSRGEGADTPETAVGRPVLDCETRLVDESGNVLEGAAEGILELAGPVLADGTGGGRPGDDWFTTDERFRRDESDAYRIVE